MLVEKNFLLWGFIALSAVPSMHLTTGACRDEILLLEILCMFALVHYGTCTSMGPPMIPTIRGDVWTKRHFLDC